MKQVDQKNSERGGVEFLIFASPLESTVYNMNSCEMPKTGYPADVLLYGNRTSGGRLMTFPRMESMLHTLSAKRSVCELWMNRSDVLRPCSGCPETGAVCL